MDKKKSSSSKKKSSSSKKKSSSSKKKSSSSKKKSSSSKKKSSSSKKKSSSVKEPTSSKPEHLVDITSSAVREDPYYASLGLSVAELKQQAQDEASFLKAQQAQLLAHQENLRKVQEANLLKAKQARDIELAYMSPEERAFQSGGHYPLGKGVKMMDVGLQKSEYVWAQATQTRLIENIAIVATMSMFALIVTIAVVSSFSSSEKKVLPGGKTLKQPGQN